MNSQMIFSRGLYRIRKIIRQSNLLIISDMHQAITTAINSVIFHRSLLEHYIRHHPEYQHSLEPIKVKDDSPRIIKLAAFAAEMAEVGPMAAVPGALAEIAVGDMVHHSSLVNLVENGGEIASISHKPLKVAIYAGNSPISGRIGFHLSPKDFPIGIATSSATVSSALSFGEADAVVIIAESSSLADATATAICNVVRGPDIEASVQYGLEVAEKLPHVRAAIIIRGRYIGKIGKLPRLLKLNGNPDDLFEASLYDIVPSKMKFL